MIPAENASSSRWLTALPVLLVLLPTAVILLSSETTLFHRDHILAFRHLVRTAVDAWSEGRLPLWNPWTGGGEPLLGDWNALGTSPLLVAFVVGDFSFGYDLFIALHLPVAAVGAGFMARSLRLSGAPAATTAVAYAGSGIFLAYNNLVPAFEALAFAPWALGAAWRVWTQPSLRGVAGLGVALALHAQFADPVFFLWDGLTFLAGLEVLRRAGVRPQFTSIPGLAGGAALSVGVAATQLLTLGEQLGGTRRGGGYDLERLQMFSLPAARILELGLPAFGGDYWSDANYYGPASDGRMYLVTLYCGASALVLAAVGAARFVPVRWLAAVGALAVLVALGPLTPLHGWVVELVPLLDRSRYPVKHLVGVLFTVPLVAGYGVASLRQPASIPLVGGLAGATGAGLLAGGTVAFFGGAEAFDGFASGAAPAAAAAFGAVLLLVGTARGGAWPVRAAPFLVAADLGLFSPFAFPTVSAEALEPPMVCDLLGRMGSPGYLLFDPYQDPNHIPDADLATRARYRWERGFVGSASACRVRHVLDQDLSGRRPGAWAAVFEKSLRAPPDVRLQVFRRLGIQVLGSERRVVPPGQGSVLGALSPLGGPELILQVLEGARPLAGLEPLEPAGGVREPFEALARPPPVRMGSAEVLRFEAGRIGVRTVAPAPAVLVVTQRFDPGWRVWVNGVQVEPRPVDGLLLGVELEPGEAEVRLAYHSDAAAGGAVISCVALLLAAALAGVSPVRRERKRA